MAESVTLLALPQLVDLSLNAHEGVINFQVLHTLLHILIQQSSAQEVRVEFRGPDSEHIQNILSSTKPMPQGLYPQYTVVRERNNGKRTGKKISLQDVIKEEQRPSLEDVIKQKQNIHEERRETELRVIDRRKDSKEDPDLHPLPLKSPTGSLAAVLAEDPRTVVVVNADSSLPQFSVAMKKSTFDDIQNEIDLLKTKVDELAELPGNFDLFKAARDKSAPIVDMFQILKLTKRMDAADQAIGKMGSLIEDLAKKAGEDIVGKLEEMKEAMRSTCEVKVKSSVSLTGLDERVTNLENVVNDIRARPPGAKEKDTISNLSKVSTDKSSNVSKETEEMPPTRTLSADIPYTSHLSNVELGKIPSRRALSIVQLEFESLTNWIIESFKELKEMKDERDTSDANAAVIDNKFKDYESQLENMNKLYSDVIDQINSLHQEVESIRTNILPGGDSSGIDAETTMQLVSKLDVFQEQLVTLSEHAENCERDKEQREKHAESLKEEIDLLKVVKASREELEDALADKADVCMVHGKVSHEQLEATYEELSKGIEEAVNKLEAQDEMWNHAFQAIQREVGSKLDKMEIDPIRDFFINKLKAIQEKVKTITGPRQEEEAAGTKSKLLRNVNCISCDKDVVMRMQMVSSLKPQAYAMPPPRNVAPYVAYELDQLRKQQKFLPGSKSLNETIRGNVSKDHACNRYCGGSHTVTTPQQRVTKLGHFLDRCGPEPAPLQEILKSRDDMVYKKNKDKIKTSLQTTADAEPIIPIPELELPQQDMESEVHPVFQEIATKDEENIDYAEPVALPPLFAPEERTSVSAPEKELPELQMEQPPN